MEAISLSSLSLTSKPKPNSHQNRNNIYRSSTSVVASMRRGSSSSYDDRDFNGGRLVDENMIVLRKRIHEMKMIEKSYQPPSDWMEWEKRWYTSYDSFICEVMGMLQSQLMNTRPSLALGMLALIMLSLPMSTSTILFHFIEMSKGVISSM